CMLKNAALSGLKRRSLTAMIAVTAGLLVVALLLLYMNAEGALSNRAFAWLLIGSLAVAAAAALAIIAALAESFTRPLHAVAGALNRAARGDFETPADLGKASELRELSAAVNSMRTSLRSSTISRNYLDR